jgi:hypothetical protein
MKTSDTTRLMAAALAWTLGSAAYALPPTTPIDFTIYAGGSPDQADTAFGAATQFLTSIDSYTDQASGANSSSYRILFGRTTRTIGTLPSGRNVLYFYKFNGGTISNGILPQVGAGSTLAYPTIFSVQSAAAVVGNTFPQPTFKFTAAITNNQIPDWGITDTDVNLFNHADNLGGLPPLTGSQLQSIQAGPPANNQPTANIYDNAYGVVVTNNLYAKKTNFTRVEVAGILGGAITDWSQLFDDSGTPLAAGAVILLDRASGSGPKAAGSLYFLGYGGCEGTDPNSVSNAAGAGGAVGSGINAGYTSTVLVLGSSYQDVREPSSAALVADLKAAQAAGQRAIAILGLEFPPPLNQVAGANVYSFVKINGVGVDTGTTGDNVNGPHGGGSATKHTNVVTGGYEFFYQGSFNFRTNLTGDRLAFKNEVLADLQGNSVPALTARLVDPLIAGIQSPGVVTTSRFGLATNRLEQIFDAVSSGGALQFRSDPL